METEIQKKGEVILYHPSETIKLEVRLENETVWLTQAQMSELFNVSKQNISLHVNNVFKEKELLPSATVKESLTVQKEGSRTISRIVKHYNLDVIISVGYRVKSHIGTQFRQWALQVIKDHIIRGYSLSKELTDIQKHIDSRLIRMQEYSDNRFLILEQKVEHQQEQIELYIKTNEEPKEQLFGNGCVFDAWNYISDLVRSAKREIVLIDNYVDDTVLAILSKREKGVKTTVHSRYRAKFITDLEKYNKQFPDAEVDFIQFSDKNHDRFLIIDDIVYMLGNSVKDFGNAWGAVIKMEMSKGDILAMVERR